MAFDLPIQKKQPTRTATGQKFCTIPKAQLVHPLTWELTNLVITLEILVGWRNSNRDCG
jgi:hypothetical protein